MNNLSPVSFDAARAYLRLSTPRAALAQFEDLIESGDPGFTAWLHAALEEGLLDINVLPDLPGPSDAPTDAPFDLLPPSARAVLEYAKGSRDAMGGLPGVPYGNDPQEDRGLIDVDCAPYRPHVPDGFAAFLRAWTQRARSHLQAQLAVRCDEAGQQMARRAYRQSAGAIALMAIGLDEVEIVSQLTTDPEFGASFSQCPYIPVEMVTGNLAHNSPDAPWLHWGAVAMNYGSTRCFQHFLDLGWDPVTQAVLAVDRPFADGVRRPMGVTELLLASGAIRIAPSLVARALEGVKADYATTSKLDAFIKRLHRITTQPENTIRWGELALACGIDRIAPVMLMQEALASACVPLAERLAPKIQWNQFQGEGEPAKYSAEVLLSTVQGLAKSRVLSDLDPDQRSHALCWLIEQLAAFSDPGPLNQVFYRAVNESGSVVQEVIKCELADVLLCMLEHGLDPLRKSLLPSDDGGETCWVEKFSALEVAAANQSQPRMLALMQAFMARAAALDAATQIAAEIGWELSGGNPARA